MSLLGDVDRVKGTVVLTAVALVLLLLPGITSLFYYHREILMGLDGLKLTLVSLAFVGPGILLLYLPILLWVVDLEVNDGIDPNQQSPAQLLALVICSFLISLTFYLSLGISIIYRKSFNFSFKLSLILYIIFSLSGLVSYYKYRTSVGSKHVKSGK